MNQHVETGDSTSPSGLVRQAALLAGASALGIFLLHPRMAIRDIDGYEFLIGARSLQQGHGYRDLAGGLLTHHPPGYSILLSGFPDALWGAVVVNYLSFGVVMGLLYYLLRRMGWTWQAGLGLCGALGGGFFRLLASEIHADVPTYACFLAAMTLVIPGTRRPVSALILALLAGVKLVAGLFLPPAFAADVLTGTRDVKTLVRWYLPAVLVSALCVGAVLYRDAMAAGTWAMASHSESPAFILWWGAKTFARSIPRTFLFNWHGTAVAAVPLTAFAVCTILAAIGVCSLRPVADRAGRWFRVYGIAFLVGAGLLLFLRGYEPSARLTGYGIIIFLLGFRPRRWANGVWLAYGAVSLVAGVANGVTADALGLNDPRYVTLVDQVRSDPVLAAGQPVASNSFHLLDVHAGIASVPVRNYRQADAYSTFFWVTLPVADGVIPLGHPGPEWCEAKRVPGGILFTRCAN